MLLGNAWISGFQAEKRPLSFKILKPVPHNYGFEIFQPMIKSLLLVKFIINIYLEKKGNKNS